jgi:large subunit ribosomal protein L29
MKAKDLINKSVVELQEELESLLKAYFKLRLKRGLQEAIKVGEIKDVRRNIARVKTILHQKAV